MLKQSQLVRKLLLSFPLVLLPACDKTSYPDRTPYRSPEAEKVLRITVAGSEKNAGAYVATNTKEDEKNGIYPTEYFMINDTGLSFELKNSLTREHDQIKKQNK